MTEKNCGYHHEGYCLKGLPGTPCEVVGCVAHTAVPSGRYTQNLGVMCTVRTALNEAGCEKIYEEKVSGVGHRRAASEEKN